MESTLTLTLTLTDREHNRRVAEVCGAALVVYSHGALHSRQYVLPCQWNLGPPEVRVTGGVSP